MASTWLDGFGDWAWPGGPNPAVDVGPATWVPSTPLMAVEAAPLHPRVAAPRVSTLPRPLRLARLVLLLAVAGATFALSNRFIFSRTVPASHAVTTPLLLPAVLTNPFSTAPALPAHETASVPEAPAPAVPVVLTRYSAGGEVAQLTFASAALRHRDRFLVYLPPHYATSQTRYPVIYLLHGDRQPASSFVRLGVPQALGALISSHAINPVIAVMLQGGGAPADWENGWSGNYYSYVGEVQQLVDRSLRTVASRSGRAIAGYSMGGFGAMNIALTQLRDYSVVESWEGQFTSLAPKLAADRRLLHELPLQAFVWGGAQDRTVDSALDAPWAAELRAAGAHARSAVYPGAHAFGPIETHLRAMLSFAARALRS
ncbi:MAG TPA: alpha/beta hydrolase-fold protein [Solirubrobacteraceae bacterium]|nr:alpha/beta hydrolase-fold protein [Solirubrobacteraceae bacterium]